MKILIIHNRYQQAGGEQAVVDSQVQLLRQKGHELLFYTRDNQEIKEYNVLKKIRFFFETIYSHKTVLEIKDLIAKNSPDIVHIHNVFPLISPSVYRVLQQERIPIVQTIHNFRLLCPNGLFYTHGKICERCKMGNMIYAAYYKCYKNSFLLSALYAFSISLHRRWGTYSYISCFLALNKFSADKFLESKITTSSKIRVLPNYYEQDENGVAPQGGKNDAVIFIGRLSQEKGVMDLIECAKILPELKLIIVGSGPLTAALKIAAQNLKKRVEFLGFLSGKEKQKVINQALIQVIPSRCYEQFPMSALEGMTAGNALVVPNLGGWPFIVQDGKNGLLYQSGNVHDLARKIKILLDDSSLAIEMGQKGRQMAMEHFSSEKYYQGLINIYNELINEQHRE